VGNLFGLQIELLESSDTSVGGRMFVKQDHQGAGGSCHVGILAAALEEMMALALGGPSGQPHVHSFEMSSYSEVQVGRFIGLTAWVEPLEGGANRVRARASASDNSDESQCVAEASARFDGPT
jgi:acyl-coenzyme A thioesterase PaaI-like protein